MKQVTQTLRTGIVEINEVPIPTISDSFVLVRNSASVISAGTEKAKIDMGKKNLLQKAQARPDLVKQVLNKIKTEGITKTLQTVNSRLTSPSPLGYSTSGEVVSVGGMVEGVQPGNRVACGGAGYANHAEFVAVPKNLIVKVPDNVSDEEAAFTTLGSIALQGVRLADPKIGETFVVLGLGLLGQITVQLLKANGCRVIGLDLDASLVERAEKFGAIGIHPGSDPIITCKELTGGYGVDGILVCAGTSSNQPIELCGEITREKGRVVVVGAVRMDIPRETYFKKEISVVISRSYGPGRYDPSYEEMGHDYPYGYVRFTEQRNMETFLQLLASGDINVKSLITHSFELDDAAIAYQLIEGEKKEPYLGIILTYSGSATFDNSTARILMDKSDPIDKQRAIKCSFFGAGNYATATLLPPLKGSTDVSLAGLVTASGRTAQGVAKQFGFDFCAGDYDELLKSDTDVIAIVTRHDTHAEAVAKALEAGKHVYVEKPLGLTVEELQRVYRAYSTGEGAQLMVGFNRRFSPLTEKVKGHFKGVQSPLIIDIRTNAGSIPSDHWIQDGLVGGGRVIGEGCHFVDLATHLADSLPVQVFAYGTNKAEKSPLLNDNVIVSIKFENGSVATVTYVADGSKAMTKERIEVFGGGRSATLDDFKSVVLYSGDSQVKKESLSAQNKGQKQMIEQWLDGIRVGKPCITSKELFLTSLATVMAVESLCIGYPVNISEDVLIAD